MRVCACSGWVLVVSAEEAGSSQQRPPRETPRARHNRRPQYNQRWGGGGGGGGHGTSRHNAHAPSSGPAVDTTAGSPARVHGVQGSGAGHVSDSRCGEYFSNRSTYYFLHLDDKRFPSPNFISNTQNNVGRFFCVLDRLWRPPRPVHLHCVAVGGSGVGEVPHVNRTITQQNVPRWHMQCLSVGQFVTTSCGRTIRLPTKSSSHRRVRH